MTYVVVFFLPLPEGVVATFGSVVVNLSVAVSFAVVGRGVVVILVVISVGLAGSFEATVVGNKVSKKNISESTIAKVVMKRTQFKRLLQKMPSKFIQKIK